MISNHELINLKQNRTLSGKQHPTTGHLRYLLRTIRKQIKNTEKTNPEYSLLRKKEKTIMVQRTKSPTILPNTKLTKIRYYRYADDWILFVDGSRILPILIKNKIQTWLKTYLNLELSSEKTLITNLHKSFAHFLGFGIKVQKKTQKNKKKENWEHHCPYTGVGNGIFTIDIPRLESRLRIKRFIHPLYRKPHHKHGQSLKITE